MTLRRARVSAGALLIVAVLAGCSTAPSAGEPEPGSADATASPTPSAPAPATAAPATPTASPTAAEPTCDDVLTAEEYAAIADAGMTFEGGLSFPPPAAEDLAADGALGCTWRQGDLSVLLARLVESDQAWAGRSAELAAQGWTATDTAVPHPGALIRYPEFDRSLQPAVLRLGGVTYYAAPGRILGSLSDLQR